MPTINTASTATVILRRKSRLGKIFLDAGRLHVGGRVSRRRLRGCGRRSCNWRRRFRTARYVDVDESESLTTGDTEVTEYRWDVRNRLIRVEDYAQYGGPLAQAVDYLYDVENRWIGESIDENGDGLIDLQKRFAYDGGQIVLQFEGAGDSGLGASDLSHRYLWQPNAVDQLLADERVHSENGDIVTDEVLYALTDHLGTVRDLAVVEDGVTAVANHRVFDSYGDLISETDSDIVCLIGFTGRAFDPHTGLQDNWHRKYDPATGRWMSKDPIGYYGLQTNLYVYCGNSPTNAIDPSGLVILISRSGPDPEFPKKVEEALRKIMSDPNGKAFIESLENSKYVILIRSAGKNNTRAKSDYKLGKGTGSFVDWNSGSTGRRIKRPSFIGLAHELGHAEAIANGTQSPPPSKGFNPRPGTTPPSEVNALRRENQIRRAHGLPERLSYY